MENFYSVHLDCGHTNAIVISGNPNPDANFGIQCLIPGCQHSRLAFYHASMLAPAGLVAPPPLKETP